MGTSDRRPIKDRVKRIDTSPQFQGAGSLSESENLITRWSAGSRNLLLIYITAFTRR